MFLVRNMNFFIERFNFYLLWDTFYFDELFNFMPIKTLHHDGKEILELLN